MTAINFTENDLSNPVANGSRRVQAYNDNVGEMLDGVFGNAIDVVDTNTRSLIESLGGTVVSHETIPDWAHEQEAANDNEPVQLDLFDR